MDQFIVCYFSEIAICIIILYLVLVLQRVKEKILASDWNKKKQRAKNAKQISNRVVRYASASLRTKFQRQMERVYSTVRPGHSHQTAASERNSATETMLAVVRKLGLTPYIISPSPREKDCDGIRDYYTLADLRSDAKNDPITEDHVIIMTDVDYYVNMDEILSYGRPILLYTFQPTKVSGTVNDGYFTIDEDTVTYHVKGGKDVKHQIWNYSVDTIYSPNIITGRFETYFYAITDALGELTPISGWFNLISSICDLTPYHEVVRNFLYQTVTVSTIDQFRLSEHRTITTIVPYARCPVDIIDTLTPATRLVRMNYQVAEEFHKEPMIEQRFNCLVHISENGPNISVGIAGELAQATLSLSLFESLRTAHAMAKARALSDTVRRSKLDNNESATLHCFLTSITHATPDIVHSPGLFARHFNSVDQEDDPVPFDNGKEYARNYAPGPLSDTAVFPTESYNNDCATIRGRIDIPQKIARSTQYIKPQFLSFAHEFVSRILKNTPDRLGQPYSSDYVIEKQNKPRQRERNSQGMFHVIDKFVVRAFQKREAYNGPNYPRNISNVPGYHNTRLSGFTYAFKDAVLKLHDWYQPCRTPEEIAANVHALALKHDSLVETDYSKFDGTVTRWIRENVEFPCYLRWVAPEHRDELHKLLISELDAPGLTNTIAYKPGCSRLSGSPLTTDGNTICNAFVSYCTARSMKFTEEEAFRDIGLCYGDDGLRGGNVTNNKLRKIASRLGFDLRVCNRATPGTPVSFLSRVFADPWTSPASIQSPLRTLLKIHTTVDRNAKLPVVGAAKTTAYLVTDSRTPFIGDWCRAYQKAAKTQPVADYKDLDDIPYWVTDPESLTHPWPQDDPENYMDIVAAELGISASELADHIKLLNDYSGDVDGIPVLQTTIDQTPKLAVVLDGEIHAGPNRANEVTNHGKSRQDNPSAKHRGSGVVERKDRARPSDASATSRISAKPNYPRGSTRPHKDSKERTTAVGSEHRSADQANSPKRETHGKRSRQSGRGRGKNPTAGGSSGTTTSGVL
jgi:hypothetical protein